MSKNPSNTDMQAMNELIERDRLLASKKMAVDADKINSQYEVIQKREETRKLQESAVFVPNDTSDLDKIFKSIDSDRSSFKTRENFLTQEFKDKISFTRGHLSFFLAPTGSGKTMILSNLCYNCILMHEKKKSCLVITNEERPEDVYGRIACLINGWNYNERESFTDEQWEFVKQVAKNLKSSGAVQVKDNDAFADATVSLEGIQTILNSLLKDSIHYDLVILDYFQGVHKSIHREIDSHRAQDALTNFLNDFKNKYSGSVVVLAQIRPKQEKENWYAMDRTIGSKSLFIRATSIIEMETNFEEHSNTWYVHKSRFNGSTGKQFDTAWIAGKICSLSDPKASEIKKRVSDRYLAEEIDKSSKGRRKR